MRFFSALALVLFASALQAQQPRVQHARLTTVTLDQGLAAKLAQLERNAAPQWVGYSVPVVTPFNSSWDGGRVSYLEGKEYDSETIGEKSTPQDHAVILARLVGGRLDKLRSVSPDQIVDVGDLPLTWLANVKPEESVATLKDLALGVERLREPAIFLISIHRTPAAESTLEALASGGPGLSVREHAAFWLANGRGHEGFLAIQNLARKDGDAALREKLTFDLTLSKDPAALDELIRMAHDDGSPKVRAQAQFWMAQQARKADAGRIAENLRHMAEDDPNAQTRKQAVFAVSRLPADQAVARLTELARTSTHPEVREQAVFWLGQSKDPRALEYLTRLLKGESTR